MENQVRGNSMFKSILNYEGIYQINEYAEVFRIMKDGSKHKMTPSLMGKRKQYLAVCLCKDGKQSTLNIHKLVWEAFNGPVPEGCQIHHRDKNKLNNNLSNLICLNKKEHNALHKDEETNKRRSQKLKGHKVSEATRMKIRNANLNNTNALGHIVTEQAKQRMSQSHLGKKRGVR